MSLERFEELYERFADGALRPDERKEFQAFLSESRYRARLVELSAFEASVSEETRLLEEAGGPSVPWEDDWAAPPLWKKDPRGSSRRLAAVRLRKPEPPRWRSGGLVAAGAILVAGGLLFLLASESGESRRSPAQGPHPGMSRGVSTWGSSSGTSSEPAPEPKPDVPRQTPAEALAVREVQSPRELPIREPEPRPIEPLPPVPGSPPARAEARPTTETAPAPAPAPSLPSALPPMAYLERSQGEVFLLSEEGSRAAPAGEGLRSGQGLRVGPGGSALLRWSDGTRLELGPDTEVPQLADGAGGKMAHLDHGLLRVEAARQAPGHPLVLLTPHAESKVLGTEFSLYTTPGFTRIDVREGRVKFTRLPGVTSLIVRAGHYAIAGAGFEFAERMTFSLWKPSMAGLQLWLRADSGVKLAGNGVAAWKDQSPAGNDATQTDPPSQPILVPGALQGRPALRFDGIDQYLALPSGFGDFRAGLSVFIVARVGAAPTTLRFLDLGEGPTCDNVCWGRKDAPDRLTFWVYANCVSRGTVSAPGGILIDQYQSLSVVSAPAPGQVTLYRNGTPVGSGITTVPRDVVRKPNFIGRSNTSGEPTLKGDLCEILLFNRALKDEERISIERYLVSKYFDPTAPPVLGRPAEK